jgi:hypothetical protein
MANQIFLYLASVADIQTVETHYCLQRKERFPSLLDVRIIKHETQRNIC